MPPAARDRRVLARDDLPLLLDRLREDGYRLVGPTVRDAAVVLEPIERLEDLPAGWADEQAPGRYRLARRGDGAFFRHGPGPGSLKSLFFVPELPLVRLRREGGGIVPLDAGSEAPPRLAVVGARSCDLHGVEIQDRTFLRGPHVDPDYRARRERVFVVAVHCFVPGGTCFCDSMGTGPRATLGFDLALAELLEGGHRFVVEAGTEAGAALLERLPATPATEDDLAAVEAGLEEARRSMGRRIEAAGIRELLLENLEHPRWDDVAGRCLACTNCTLVCPTCFCAAVDETTDLAGATATRTRRWDSCFTLGHSYLHGGSVRSSIRARYRQWLVHKVATWIDQFGVSGCVGCGRCITWCPVGIDLTEEIGAIRAGAGGGR